MAEALINHLWQSTVYALVAGLLTLGFRRSGAQVRFAIWLSASVKFLVPFSLLVWVGARLRWEAVPGAQAAVGSGFSVVMGQIVDPAAVVASNVSATPWARAAVQSHLNGWLILLAVWLAGVLVLVGRRLFQWLYLRAVVEAATPVDLDTPIPVLETRSTLEPGVFGIFSATLLLPQGIALQLGPAQLNAIVAHELCHWRRRDNLSAAVHMLMEVLFWFYPLVWWLGGRLIVERERACDEAVIQQGGDRQTYAEGIMRVCQHYVEPPFCSAGVSGGSLRKRMEEIMTNPVMGKLSLGRRLMLVAAGVAVIAGPLAVGRGQGVDQGGAAAGGTVEMRHYRNSQWNFELDVPKRWVVMPPVPSNSPGEVIRFNSAEEGTHGLIVFRNPVDPNRSLKQVVDDVQQVLAKAGFSNFVQGEVTIGSRQVPTLDFSRVRPDGKVWSCRHYFFAEGTLGYVLGFGSTNREAMFDLYDRMAKSFVFGEV